MNNLIETFLNKDLPRTKYELRDLAKEKQILFEGGTNIVRGLMAINFVIQLNAQLVYETGFNVGGSAAVMSEALQYTGGKLVSFEIDKSKRPVADRFLELYPNSEIVWGDSRQTLEQRWQNTNECPDFFFVDGGHSEEICSYDFNHALKIVKPGGVIMVDDTSNAPVKNVIHSLVPDIGSMWFEGEHQGTGVVVYQKPR